MLDLITAAVLWPAANPEEAAGAVLGLLGAFLLAGKGKHAPWGWAAFLASNFALIAFALRHGHVGVLVLQLGFTLTSALGVWTWLVKPQLFWHEWRGDLDGSRVVMRIRHLAQWRGRRLDLHEMVAADSPACFHTHPARALRIVLWGGYWEEVLHREHPGRRVYESSMKRWRPGMFGIVRPELAHRIASLPRGRSYSLWLRWPKTHDVRLRGPGWSAPGRLTGDVEGAQA